MASPDFDDETIRSHSQESAHEQGYGFAMSKYSIARRPVGSSGAQDAQETKPFFHVNANEVHGTSRSSTLDTGDISYSHYHDTYEATKHGSRNQPFNFRALLRRLTPGRYDPLPDPKSKQHPHKAHVRRYSWRKARSQILVPGFAQLFITCFLVSALAATFAGYAREEFLDVRQRHVYNFLMTGFIIALTINLTSSMKSYVQVLRWRLIAATSLSIEELDLALDCASQTKTLKLFFLYSWKEGKWTRVQFLCLLWIFLNLASAVVTGLLGLVQEFDPVTALVLQTGSVWVVDLTSIWATDSGSNAQEFAANTYGLQGGQDYNIQLADDALTAHFLGSDLACNYTSNCIYANAADEFAAYRLNILNAQQYNQTGLAITNKSDFYVKSTAVCTSYKVLNETLDINSLYFNYEDSEGLTQQLYVATWAPGSVTYISESTPPADYVNEVLNISSSVIFDCNNTVSNVFNLTSGKVADIPFYDIQAQLMAGAIGWTEFVYYVGNTTALGTREYHIYPPDSYWSPSYQLMSTDPTNYEFDNNNDYFQDSPGVEAIIQQFSMYALAALDVNTIFRNDVTSPLLPISSVNLVITWHYAIPILIIIPALQFAFLIAVAWWANNAVIRDDSMLSTARLLMPLLDHLNVEKQNRRLSIGSVLTGGEIARTHPERDAKFFYGYTRYGFSEEPPAYSAEIIKETDKVKPRGIRNFPDGDYH